MSGKTERVVVVGASQNPERYSHRAIRLLREHGHDVVPVNPALGSILDIPVVPTISAIEGRVDTVTMYVSESVSRSMRDDLIALKPKRVIFNPGAENGELAETLTANGVEVVEGCTLVMLNTGSF